MDDIKHPPIASSVASVPPKRRVFTGEERAAAIEFAQKFGVAAAVRELRISRATVWNWFNAAHPKSWEHRRLPRSHYSPEVRARAAQRAHEIGEATAAREFDVPTSTIASWVKAHYPETPRQVRQRYTKEFREKAVELMNEVGLVQAGHDLGVKHGTLNAWRTAAHGPKFIKQVLPVLDKSQIDAAVDLAVKVGTKAAGDAFGVTHQRVSAWAQKRGIKLRKRGGQHKSFDKSLAWVKREHPELEAWRELAERWIRVQTGSISGRLLALSKLFKSYLVPLGAASAPSRFLHKTSPTPELPPSVFPNSSYGVTIINFLSEFLDWVLMDGLSTVDSSGHRTVLAEYRNPIARRSWLGGPRPLESVHSPLPYGYIEELRSMLAQGPTFRDWTLAHTALQRDTKALGSQAVDWFEVDETVIDKSDPDCVWRERLRRGGRVLEMWSPVRWVAVLEKLILPARGFQVRMLDSGEADTWRYDSVGCGMRWQRNTHPLSGGTEKRPTQRGVFRRQVEIVAKQSIKGPQVAPSAPLLYFNTNKTADSKLSGSHKGFTVPWSAAGPLHSNPFYWFEKLRNWQEKYNPLTKRTSWSELDGRHTASKSDMALAGFGESCFLFRTPEAAEEDRRFPVTGSQMESCWRLLLCAFELRLAQRGETHADGSPVRLVSHETSAVHFTQHSLRVSLITALGLEGQVPFPILQRLVGHSRLLMTIYYSKFGAAAMQRVLHSAFARLQANKSESIVAFLRNTQYDRLVEELICGSSTSLAAAITRSPTTRNAAGWMPMHIGLCLVGGNASPLEAAQTVGGCYNGGPKTSDSSAAANGPVPGGARNCVRCRWLVTRPEYLPPLVAHFNTIMYHLDEAAIACVEADRALDGLKTARMQAEDAGLKFGNAGGLRDAERRWEGLLEKFNQRVEDAAACAHLIDRCRTELDRDLPKGSDSALIAVGTSQDVKLAIEEVESELLQLSDVCEGAELYPDLDPGKAILRRSQLLDAALQREGEAPVFMTLSEPEQLKVGNAFMRRLAHACDPQSEATGLRKIVSLIDAKESLTQLLGIPLFERSDSVNTLPPMRLAALVEG